LPLDEEDEFVNVTTSIAGYADMLVELAQVVSAAADMTMTRLFGRAPAGLNATGEYDQDADHERIESEQEDVYTHPVESALRMVMLSKDGPTGGVEPPDWSVTWNPLKQQSEKEIAETRKLDRRDRSDPDRQRRHTARIAAESHYKSDRTTRRSRSTGRSGRSKRRSKRSRRPRSPATRPTWRRSDGKRRWTNPRRAIRN
jgi:hypothetical protein